MKSARVLVVQACLTLCNPMDCSLPGSSSPWNSPGKNTGVGCHSLLQWIFLTHGLNLCLLHCRWILYCLSHQGNLVINKACILFNRLLGGFITFKCLETWLFGPPLVLLCLPCGCYCWSWWRVYWFIGMHTFAEVHSKERRVWRVVM